MEINQNKMKYKRVSNIKHGNYTNYFKMYFVSIQLTSNSMI